MDEKNEITSSLPEEDDWSDLFGVDYFAEEAKVTEAVEDAPDTEAEQNSEEAVTEEAAAEDGAAGSAEEEETEDDAREEAADDKEVAEGEQVGEGENGAALEEVETDDSKPAEDLSAVLTAVQAVDPTIETFNDLEDVGLFAALLDSGKTPEEALRESSPKLQAKLAEAQKAASKKHLRSTAVGGRDDAIDMDAINAFRAAYPGKSEKETIDLYKRIKSQN